MTGSNDLDRMLGAYLEEGPRRAPERPVDTAIAYARAHPRRRDPLRIFRPDVMSRRASMFSPQLAWGLLLIALTLGAVAAVAIGSRPDNGPIVPPPTAPVTPAPSPSPSASPVPTPAAFDVLVDDTANSGFAWPIQVIDASGTLVEVANPHVSNADVERIAVDGDAVGGSRSAVLTWAPCPGGDPQRVTIDETGLVWRVERAECGTDTLGVNPIGITLTFSVPVSAGDVEVELVETPRKPSSGRLDRTDDITAG